MTIQYRWILPGGFTTMMIILGISVMIKSIHNNYLIGFLVGFAFSVFHIPLFVYSLDRATNGGKE